MHGLKTGKFVELLKKNFLTENGPPIAFATEIQKGPENTAEFEFVRADTGQCHVIQNSLIFAGINEMNEITNKQSGQWEKKKKNLKRRRMEEEEEGTEPAEHDKQQGKANESGGGAEERDYFRDLPNELVSKILLDNFGRKELARSVSLTCKLFHRIAHPRMHMLGEHTLPDMEIRETDTDWKTSLIFFRKSQRIIPLLNGPIPKNINKFGRIKIRNYDDCRISQFLHSIESLLQNGITLRIFKSDKFVETKALMKILASLARIPRIEFSTYFKKPHPLHTNLSFYRRAQSMFFLYVHYDGMIAFIYKWLHSPYAEGKKPRILSIDQIFGCKCGELIERLKEDFHKENGPPVIFTIDIMKGRPTNIPEFAMERAKTGECLVLRQLEIIYTDCGPYRHMRIFRGRIGQTFEELVSMEENEVGARQQIVEFCDDFMNGCEMKYENELDNLS